ncbi:hypothetical protein ACFU9P_33400, partial [Streptomyces sp. NPDC057617]
TGVATAATGYLVGRLRTRAGAAFSSGPIAGPPATGRSPGDRWIAAETVHAPDSTAPALAPGAVDAMGDRVPSGRPAATAAMSGPAPADPGPPPSGHRSAPGALRAGRGAAPVPGGRVVPDGRPRGAVG